MCGDSQPLCVCVQEKYLTALVKSSDRYVGLDKRIPSGSCSSSAHNSSTTAKSTQLRPPDSNIWLHEPHNGNTAPTIIVHGYAQLASLSTERQLEIVQQMLQALEKEINEAAWQTSVVSGIASSCLHRLR